MATEDLHTMILQIRNQFQLGLLLQLASIKTRCCQRIYALLQLHLVRTISACRDNKYTSARPPSANAFCVNSMLRTTGCTMIGSASFFRGFGSESERIATRSLALSQCTLERTFRCCKTLNGCTNTRSVHEREHAV